MTDNIEDGDVEIDISKLTTHDEQINTCIDLYNATMTYETELKKRIKNTDTVKMILQQDNVNVELYSEYVGYNYGKIDQCKLIVEGSLIHMEMFIDKEYIDVPHDARGMAMTMWYQTAIDNLEVISTCIDNLEKIEKDVLDANNELTIDKKEIH